MNSSGATSMIGTISGSPPSSCAAARLGARVGEDSISASGSGGSFASPGSSGYASHSSSGDGVRSGSCAQADGLATISSAASPAMSEKVRALTNRSAA